MQTKPKKLLEYIGIGLFVLVVGWGTLLIIDTVGGHFTTETIDMTAVPEPLQLKSEPRDVIYAEAKETPDGVGEVKYAYLENEVLVAEGEEVTRRTPVSQTEVLAVRQEGNERIEDLKTTFFAKPQFYEDDGQWRQIEYATTTPEVFSMSGAIKYVQKREFWERLLPGKPVFAAVSTFYPDPNTETTSVDGEVSYSDLTASFTAVDSATSIDVKLQSVYDGVDCFCYLELIDRGVFLFDTSALTAGAVVSAATMSIYVTSKANSDNDGTDYIAVISTTPASNTALVGNDFNNVGGTNFTDSPPDITAITTATYTNITLNASGIAAVATAGITKFALQEGHDFTGFNIAASATNRITLSSAETSGTSQDPKLEVTYTSSSFSMGQWFPF